jgi:type VI secretion system protein ImpA
VPVPLLFDFAALTKPIPGENPAGSSTPLILRQQLDAARKEIDPSRFAADDPMRPTEYVKADWDGIITKTMDALQTKAKDLLLAARLTEALTRRHGFVGLRDGLTLLRMLITDCWDRLAPEIDDPSDLDIRSAPLEWLDDTDHGAIFPGTIRMIPLLRSADASWSYADWQKLQGASDRAGYEAFERASLGDGSRAMEETLEVLSSCRDEIAKLRAALNEKLGSLAPGLSALEAAVIDCQRLAQQIQKRRPGVAAVASADSAAAVAVESAASSSSNSLHANGLTLSPEASREEIYRLLAEAAIRLEVLEPHSPIPHLLRRCLDLGRKPFAEMIESFVRDEAVLKEIRRELAIPPRPE